MTDAKRVLVVDDNDDIAEIVCATAKALRISCTTASDLAATLAGFDAEPALILLDLTLPWMTGAEMMAALAARGCRSRVVLMSGVGPKAMREAEALGRSLGLQIVGLLAKPFRGAELKEIFGR